jgi:hypothetical protein
MRVTHGATPPPLAQLPNGRFSPLWNRKAVLFDKFLYEDVKDQATLPKIGTKRQQRNSAGFAQMSVSFWESVKSIQDY